MREPNVTIRSEAYSNPAARYLGTLSQGASRATQTSALTTVLRILSPGATIDEYPWHRVAYGQILQVRDRLGATLAPCTANRYLTALRGVLAAAWRMQLLTTDEYMRIVDFPDIRGYRKARRRFLTQNEVVRMLQATSRARGEWIQRRDKAIVALLYASGARRSEIAALRLDGIRFEDDGTICVRVLGKGNKERDIWISGTIRPILESWYEIRGDWRGPVFMTKRLLRRQMDPGDVTDRIRTIAKRAGLGHVTPHDLRRTCFSNLLKAGVDLKVVKDIAGHEDIATTIRYDLRGELAVRAAAGKLPIPF